MRKVLLIILITLVVVTTLFSAAIFALFGTGFGRGLITSFIETELGDVFGGKAQIGSLDGRLPAAFVIRNISISDDESVWLTIDSLSIEWRPVALLSSKITVQSATISDVNLLRKPAAPDRSQDSNNAVRLIRLPRGLPNIAIRRVTLEGLHVSSSVAGRDITIDAAGSGRVNNRMSNLRLTATSREGSDFIDALIRTDTQSDHGVVDIVIASQENGAIASILELDGKAYLEIKGEAPLSAFSAKVTGDFGAYGGVNAAFEVDLHAANAFSFDATILPGDKLNAVASAFGPEISVSGELRNGEKEASITFSKIRTGMALASGSIRWTTRNGIVERAQLGLEADFENTHIAAIRQYFGSSASIQVKAEAQRDGYGFDATLRSPQIKLRLRDGDANLRSRLAAKAQFELLPNDAWPAPFETGLTGLADINLDEDGKITVKGLKLTLADESTFVGDLTYGFAANDLACSGDVSVSPALIERYVPAIRSSDPIVARVTARGVKTNFSGEIVAETPEGKFSGVSIPAAEVTVRLADLPNSFTAAVSAKPTVGKGGLDFNLSQTETGVYNIARFRLEQPLFNLTGSGSWSADSKIASINLRYFGSPDAHPLTGMTLSGSISAQGEIGLDDSVSNLKIDASDIALSDFKANSLRISLKGAMRNLAFSVMADTISESVAGRLEDFEARGIANLSEGPQFTITDLSGKHAGAPFSLIAPATLTVGSEIRVEKLRARYGAEGLLSIDGSISPERWRADIAATSLPLPKINSVITLNAALDTNEPMPAQGEFNLKSFLASDVATEIKGDLSWDGRRVRAKQDGANSPLRFEIETPLVLTRTPKIAVSASGSITGSADYKGSFQGISPYFPPEAQSLEGGLDADARISGTFAQPEIDGRLYFRDGAYTEPVSGLTLTGVHAEAAISSATTGSTIAIKAGAHGAGQPLETISFDGDARIGDVSSVDARLRFNDAELSAGPVSRATVSGAVRLNGALSSMKASGALNVKELDAQIVSPASSGLVDIDVVKTNNGEPTPTRKAQGEGSTPLALDISVKADDRIFIRGRGLDSEWRTKIQAIGDAQHPVLVGALILRKGTLDFSGRRFTFTRGAITFDQLSPNDPALDLRAEYAAPDGVTAAIEVSGRASAPSIALVSSPSRPPEDVMALVLFGKPARELTALESLQVAQALAQLSGVGPFGNGGGVTGVARRALGLDLLNVDIDADAGASSLEIGKYVSKGLFVSAKQNARGENGSIRIEYEVTNSISVETEVKQDGEQTVSANWKHDF